MPDAAYCNAKNDIEASCKSPRGSHPPAGFAGDFAIKAFVRTGCKLPSNFLDASRFHAISKKYRIQRRRP